MPQNTQADTFAIKLDQADKYLQILRADHFARVTILLPDNINDKQLRFMMHLARILRQKVTRFVTISGLNLYPQPRGQSSNQSIHPTGTKAGAFLESGPIKQGLLLKANT